MSAITQASDITAICAHFGNDPHRMLDFLGTVQAQDHWIAPATMKAVAAATGLTRIAVAGVASFYAFLSLTPMGRITIRLSDDIIEVSAGWTPLLRRLRASWAFRSARPRPIGRFRWNIPPAPGCAIRPPPR